MSINIKEEKIGEIRFPAEFEPHHGTLLIWPERPGSWGKDTSGAEKAYINIIKNLIQVEDVYLLVSKASFEAISTKLRDIFSDDYLMIMIILSVYLMIIVFLNLHLIKNQLMIIVLTLQNLYRIRLANLIFI